MSTQANSAPSSSSTKPSRFCRRLRVSPARAAALGWRSSECANLLLSSKLRFDRVLMPGTLHHLLIADQITLWAVMDRLVELYSLGTILEWIPRVDPQFAGLCKRLEKLYAQLTKGRFLQLFNEGFSIRTCEWLPKGRSIWLLERL
jgi:hypothetical protein